MNADEIYKAHGIPVYYSFYPVDKCPLYVKAPFELMLFRGQNDSDTLKGDFMVGVNKYVGNDMFNEYVDVSQPLYHLVLKGDTNSIPWVCYAESKDMQYKEYNIFKDRAQAQPLGKMAIFMGGLYKEDPYHWMSNCVDSYINDMNIKSHYTQVLNMVENTMDNPWVRVVLISTEALDSLYKIIQHDQ